MLMWRVCLFPILFIGVPGQLFAEHVLRVGVSEAMVGMLEAADGRLAGLMAEPYNCIFEDARYSVQLFALPLKRGLYYLETGELDVFLPLAKTPERDHALIFGGRLDSAEYSYVSFKPFSEESDFSRSKFVLLRGAAGKVFLPETADEVYQVNNRTQVLDMLLRDRVDVAVVPTLLVKEILGERLMDAYVRPAGILPASLYLSPKHKSAELKYQILKSVERCRFESPCSPGEDLGFAQCRSDIFF